MKWSRGQLIGHGSSAAVSLGRALPEGDVFAVKSIELSRSSALRREQEIHSTLNCDRIIEYKGCDITCENGELFYNIFLEYAHGGTLIDVIRRKGGGLIEPQIRQYTREVLKGVGHLHYNSIVHCDIKSANILVTSEGAKIGDFGCSKRIDDVEGCHLTSMAELAGTPMYMAPEVARGDQQGYSTDVWALGCTVLEMATGLAPWANVAHDPVSALYWIGFSGELPNIPGFLSPQAKDFLSKCLKRDPKERWSVDELLEHPFVNDDGLSKFALKEAHEQSFDTPTSVLGQGLWESIELDSAQKIVAHEKPEKSPWERMRELTSLVVDHKFPNWTWDEDWITVRNNSSDEGEVVSTGLGPSAAHIVEPNMTSAFDFVSSPTIELDFWSLSIELLNSYDIIKIGCLCNFIDHESNEILSLLNNGSFLQKVSSIFVLLDSLPTLYEDGYR